VKNDHSKRKMMTRLFSGPSLPPPQLLLLFLGQNSKPSVVDFLNSHDPDMTFCSFKSLFLSFPFLCKGFIIKEKEEKGEVR
jgi:hypothetical protein